MLSTNYQSERLKKCTDCTTVNTSDNTGLVGFNAVDIQ